MTDTDILVIRKMLGVLMGIGSQGLETAALKEQAEIAAGTPLTTAEKDLAARLLEERRWIASYRQPLTGRVRWYVTEAGKIAYAGL